MSSKSVPQERQVIVVTSCKSVKSERPTKVSSETSKGQVRVSYTSVEEECPMTVSCKTVLQECQVRVSYKVVK